MFLTQEIVRKLAALCQATYAKAFEGSWIKVDKPLTSRAKIEFRHGGPAGLRRGELFGPGNARLPLPPMLMFDRITTITERRRQAWQGRGRWPNSM